MAFPGNTAWYVSSVAYAAVTTWATGQAKSVGDIVKQTGTPTLGNERCYVCTVAGTTGGGADPLTTFTRGVIISDNGISWQECTGIAALNGDMTNTPTWTVGAKNQAITLGHVIKSDDGTKILICTVAGTAGNGAEPSWGTTTGVDIVDGAGALRWKLLKTGSAVFGNWAAPAARMQVALATNWGDANGQDFFIADDHAETQTVSMTTTHIPARGSSTSPDRWISVDPAGSVPPVAADLSKGAAITATGSAVSMTISGWLKWVYGITFTTGTSNTCELNIGGGEAKDKYYESCDFRVGAGAGANSNPIRGVGATAHVRTKNCTVKFTAAGQALETGGFHQFDSLTLDSGGTKPTNLFTAALGGDNDSALWIFRACDFSFFTSGTLVSLPNRRNNSYLFEDCNLASGITLVDSSNLIASDEYVTFIRCSKAAAGDHDFSFFGFQGSQEVQTTVVRNGGAVSPSAVQYAWKMVGSTACNNGSEALLSSRTGFYNETTGAHVTATVYGVANTAAMPTDTQVWLTAQYLGASGNSGATQKTSKGNMLGAGTSLTADTSDWDDGLTARQNSHAYSVGDVIKLGSNTGRIFFCTVAGTTAGSEPGGYASAVDGGTVSDGSATFRAGWRFSMTVALSSPDPAQVGLVHAWIGLGAASTTVYVDPLIEVA